MLTGYDPIVQALLAGLFTWGVTALGAALVFVLPRESKKFLDVSLGFAAGIMTAASFWSLLAPAIEIAETMYGAYGCVPVAFGFAIGAAFVQLSDHLIPSCVVAEMSLLRVLAKERVDATDANVRVDEGAHLPMVATELDIATATKERYADATRTPPQLRHRSRAAMAASTPSPRGASGGGGAEEALVSPAAAAATSDAPLTEAEKRRAENAVSWRRVLLLIMAVTAHNMPEGLAVGVGFASIGKTPTATFEKAFNLALGIGLQNFPEGLAVSLPLAGFGYSPWRAFTYGQLSGIVEPFAAVLGAAAVVLMEPVLPYALSGAAGCMLFVVFDSIIPEAQRNGNGKLASFGAICGFIVMMVLDISLG